MSRNERKTVRVDPPPPTLKKLLPRKKLSKRTKLQFRRIRELATRLKLTSKFPRLLNLHGSKSLLATLMSSSTMA
jgi:hypothetical protein